MGPDFRSAAGDAGKRLRTAEKGSKAGLDIIKKNSLSHIGLCGTLKKQQRAGNIFPYRKDLLESMSRHLPTKYMSTKNRQSFKNPQFNKPLQTEDSTPHSFVQEVWIYSTAIRVLPERGENTAC